MLDWNDLRYLLAVHRGGSLAQAARALGVDKATVSRRIAALEEAFGVRLFDRKPDGYQLTPHGERVVRTVSDIDQTVDALATDLSEARGEATGTVHVTVPLFFARRLLFPSLPAFLAAHPGIELVVSASSSVLNLAQREAEVALRNVKPTQKSLSSRRAGVLGSALYGARAYLDRHGRPRAQAELARHRLVAYERVISHVSAFAWLDDSGARVAVRTTDADALAAAASSGAGLAVLPCVVGDEERALERLDAFGVGAEDIHVVMPSELRRAVRVRAVVELLLRVWEENAARLAGAQPPTKTSG